MRLGLAIAASLLPSLTSVSKRERERDRKRNRDRAREGRGLIWARMHHKVVGNFGSDTDVRSLYYRLFRFNDTSDIGACTHGRSAK